VSNFDGSSQMEGLIRVLPGRRGACDGNENGDDPSQIEPWERVSPQGGADVLARQLGTPKGAAMLACSMVGSAWLIGFDGWTRAALRGRRDVLSAPELWPGRVMWHGLRLPGGFFTNAANGRQGSGTDERNRRQG
jgi:hypothetical protein